jgi:hypothetical protein
VSQIKRRRSILDVTGDWRLFYDWDCEGRYCITDISFHADGTLTCAEGWSGQWVWLAGMILFWNDGLEVVYSGNLVRSCIAGIAANFDSRGWRGCFYMLQSGAPLYDEFTAMRVGEKPDSMGQ